VADSILTLIIDAGSGFHLSLSLFTCRTPNQCSPGRLELGRGNRNVSSRLKSTSRVRFERLLRTHVCCRGQTLRHASKLDARWSDAMQKGELLAGFPTSTSISSHITLRKLCSMPGLGLHRGLGYQERYRPILPPVRQPRALSLFWPG
jgi:hypothetical protein